MADRVFGEIPGYPEGSHFPSRRDLARAGLHRPLQAGISGSAEEGAESIVVSGGYQDDHDRGVELEYTGEGGRDPETGEQIADQELNGRNAALVRSKTLQLPVRVIRGASSHSAIAPKAGYRYDGLYHVVECQQEKGASGYQVWHYRLRKIDPSTTPWQHAALAGQRTAKTRPMVPAAPRTLRSPAVRPQVVQPPPPPPPGPVHLNVGDRVKHPIFGEGRVMTVQPSAQEMIVTIDFGTLGSKKLIESQAHLEVLS